MKIIELIKEEKMKVIQLSVIFFVFLIFFLNVFITLLPIFFYILIILIIGNIVLGILNKKRNIGLNIVLLMLSFLMFVFLIGYFATIIGTIISFIYLFTFGLRIFVKD